MTFCRSIELPPAPHGKNDWPWTGGYSPLPATLANGHPWPRITIVTPSFNQCDYLEETIRSVLLQGYPNLEYIVIDGGSSDGSVEIIERYASYLAYWTSERDRGQAEAINKGFRRSSGHIMGWLNSDDCLTPGALQRIATAFRNDPAVNVVCGFRGLIVGKERVRGVTIHLPPDRYSLSRSCYIAQETIYWTRSVWERVGELDESYQFALDYEFWQRILAAGYRFRLIPYINGLFRVHPNSKTSSWTDRRTAELARIYRQYLNTGKSEKALLAEMSLVWRVRMLILQILGRAGILTHPRWLQPAVSRLSLGDGQIPSIQVRASRAAKSRNALQRSEPDEELRSDHSIAVLTEPTNAHPALPLVSTVTPSYNQAHFIRETIESVLNQDYPNIEYWVIDGGSTDGTVEILREYERDPRFHWISERDRGQTDAINKGWARSKGDILCWLNSDDCFVDAGAVGKQVSALLSKPEAGLVYGDGLYTDAAGKELSHYPTGPYAYATLLRMNYIMQPTVFIRREIFEQIGPLDVSFRFAMDRDYWLRCAAVTTLMYNPVPIATYRLHQDSKTVDANMPMNLDGFGATCKHLEGARGPALTTRERRHVLASRLVNLAIRAIRAGELDLARRMVRGALRLNPTDPRYASALLALLDHGTGWELQPKLAGLIFYLLNPRLRHNRVVNERHAW